MTRLVLVLALLAAACDTPPFKLVYRISAGPTQSCAPVDFDEDATLSCSDVPMACDAVLNIRVLDPDDPSAPFISVCEVVPQSDRDNLCSIARIDLPSDVRLPKKKLEVQVLVWPRSMVDNPTTGEPDCRKFDVSFDAAEGFPLAQVPAPALGGHAYYEPGDEEVVVTLGCTDLAAVNDAVCVGTNALDATATIDDFETGVSVSRTLAERLSVAVGEPQLNTAAMAYELNPNDTRRLDLVGSGPVPAWTAALELDLDTAACIEVREDEPQATATVSCARLTDPGVTPSSDQLVLGGVRLSKASFEQILDAVGLTDVPASGITIGIVRDPAENPLAGYVVSTTSGTIKYLDANRTGVVNGATSASGIFVSQDAPYGSDFSTTNPQFQTVSRPGGLIKGKVTIVVLQFASGGTD